MEIKQYLNELIKRAVEDLNQNIDESLRHEYSENLCFIGKESEFDSMDRVCMIEYIETTLEEEKGVAIELLADPWFKDNKACSMKQLQDYIERRLGELK